MDRTKDAYAYRCLPLVIANQHGWELLSDGVHEAIWNGGDHRDDIDVSSSNVEAAAASHFGHGILTLHVPCIFRTAPGVNLWVGGPVNQAKDGIAPLSGLIEADWMPYSFTMNWQFTRANQRIRFDNGEPICSFFPVARGFIETAEPEFRALDTDQTTKAGYQAWSTDRDKLNDQIFKNLTSARERGWQRDYFQGRWPHGERFENHQTKLQVKPFRDLG
jgi:hypothetical protein